jgi:hypothetical protein
MRTRLWLPVVTIVACVGCASQGVSGVGDEPALAEPPLRPSAANDAKDAGQDAGQAAAAPGPASVETAPGQQVALHHCGVQDVTYDGRTWEVENDPFDLTNAPDTFSGFGSFGRSGDTLTFTDRAGARLTFTPYDGTPDPYNCA